MVVVTTVGTMMVALGTATIGATPSPAQTDRVPVNPPITFVQDPDPTTSTTAATTTTFITTVTATTTVNPSVPVDSTPTATTTPSTATTLVPGATGDTTIPDPNATTTSAATGPIPVPALGDTSAATTAVTPVPALGDTSVATTGTIPPIPANAATTIARLPARNANAATTTTLAPRTPAELRQRIDAILAPVPSVVAEITIDGYGVVYDRNADRGVLPASTQKIYTIGAALLRLGGDMRFVTDIRSSALVGPDGRLAGDLVVRASGDPSFSTAGIKALAEGAFRSGVREVSGDLVVDGSHFDAQRSNQGWKASFMPGEVGALSAFSVNGNHVATNAVDDPAVKNLAMLRTALAARGITVRGGSRSGTLPLGGPVLGSVTSPPIRDLAAFALKKSENTYAELLLKELGASAGNGSTLGGIDLVRQQFAAFGVAAPVMADGSGLSSLNRSTAAQQVAWLSKLRLARGGIEFRAALPVACIDGTLKSRFCRTPAAGRILAKTGTLDHVTALSGYATLASGKTAVFSLIGNDLASTSRARAAIDQSLVVLVSSALP